METSANTVVFDLGNVVVLLHQERVCQRLAQRYAIGEQSVARKIFGGEIERAFDEGRLSPEGFTEACSRTLEVQLDLSEFKAIWSDMFTENRPVVDIIKEVQRTSKVILLSNTNVWHIEQISRQFDVLDLFDELVLSFQVGYSKPDRRIFERVPAGNTSSKPIIYVDDIEAYVKAAIDVGWCGLQYRDADSLRRALVDRGIL